MSIANIEPLLEPFESTGRLFTAADLELMPTDLPSGPIDFELDNGRLVFIMVPPGNTHGAAQVKIVTQLMIQGEFKSHGKVRTEVGVILWRDPDRVVSPDVFFVAKKSLPIKTSREGYLETIPELVVEIRSKNDSLQYIERKVQHYLQAGVELVWVADPSTKTIAAHTVDGQVTIFNDGDTLTLPNIIPEFSMAVADVFQE